MSTAEQSEGSHRADPAGPLDEDGHATSIEPIGEDAAAVFGGQLALAERYVDLLAGDGVEHGLLGPRELPRIWSRHLINCAVVTDLLPRGARVADIGSGAGLPGLAMAVRRTDLEVILVEPMQRRVEFLERCIAELQLGGRARVVRGRADDAVVRSAVAPSRWVTARAVAPLDRLVRWCFPLLGPDGELLALKGRRAADEAAESGPALRRERAQVRAVEIVAAGADVSRVVVVGRVPGDAARKVRR